jgi:hypothetical protein
MKNEHVSAVQKPQRVDRDINLIVSAEQAEAFWKDISTRYIQPRILRTLGSDVTSKLSIEHFVDTYFDTRDLILLKRQGEIRRRQRFFADGHSKELLQIKTPYDDNLGISETKFNVQKSMRGRSAEGFSPLAFLRKKDIRKASQAIKEMFKLDPNALSSSLIIKQERRRVYIANDGQALFTFTLDFFESRKFFTTAKLVQFEVEINEIRYSDASELEKERLVELAENEKKKILSLFPSLRQVQGSKYSKIHRALKARNILFKVYTLAAEVGLM